MKHSVSTVTIFSLLASATAAYADNKEVEDALKRQPDLSSFYQILMDTGVNHELNANMAYTIFAPTNEAMSTIRQDKYPCFYQAECYAEGARVIRNHIVPGLFYVSDAIGHKGGFFSIGGRFIAIGEPYRNGYAIEGRNILSSSSYGGGRLYTIDGVIANRYELMQLQYAEPKETTSVVRKTIPDPACGPAGCPDETTETTTIIRTVVTPVR